MKAPQPPADYRNLAVEEAAQKFYDRGLFKDGLWNVDFKINSAAIATLPDDGPAAKMIVAMVADKVARQPARELNFCLSRVGIAGKGLPGFNPSCRYESLHFDADGGHGVMTCQKSQDMDAGGATYTYKLLKDGFQMDTALESVTDLGGTAKPRPKRASMTAIWKFIGACPAAQSAPNGSGFARPAV
ncbi:MAG TPA: hypothetical protein VGE05_05915 [Novosphingobium sp.]